MQTPTPQESVQIFEKWLNFYPGPFTNFPIIVPQLKAHLGLPTPCFWYALYTLQEDGKLFFEEPKEPLVLTIGKNQK